MPNDDAALQKKAANLIDHCSATPEDSSVSGRHLLGHKPASPNAATVTCVCSSCKPPKFILMRPASWPKHGFGIWLARTAQRLHPNVLAAALANKLARIAWTVLARERSYQARVTMTAA